MRPHKKAKQKNQFRQTSLKSKISKLLYCLKNIIAKINNGVEVLDEQR